MLGALVSGRGQREAAEAQADALQRWRERRAALTKALTDSYTKEGDAQQQGQTAQLQALGSGDAARAARASVGDTSVTAPEAADGANPFFRAAFARRAAGATKGVNLGLAAQAAALRRRNFADAINRQAAVASAGSRFRAPEFSRARFLNAMEANRADSDFRREFGEVPNSARNLMMLGGAMTAGENLGLKALGGGML